MTPRSHAIEPGGDARALRRAISPDVVARALGMRPHAVRGLRATPYPRSALLQRLGHPLAMLDVNNLYGVQNGKQRHLGSCFKDGQPLSFSIWLPHGGVALDLRAPDEEERTLKAAFCNRASAIYCWLESYRDPDLGPRHRAYVYSDGEVQVVPLDQLIDAIRERYKEAA